MNMNRRVDAVKVSKAERKSRSGYVATGGSVDDVCDNERHGCSKNTRREPDNAGAAGANTGINTQPSASPSPREILLPHNAFVVFFMKSVGILLVVFYFAIPAFVKIYPAILIDVAFLNHLRWPPFINLTNPDELGINGTRNFRLEITSEITVGAWHVLPESLSSPAALQNRESFVDLLSQGSPVIFYLHGNAGTRAGWHRIQLYKVLSKAGFHVITFDYRGYGDSLGYPSEDGLVEDSVFVFKWIKKHSGTAPVFIWGHSLGSGVATKTAKKLNEADETFDGLILESPFNNFIEAASNHPFSLPFRIMPWFTWVFIEGIKENNIRFASDENISGVKARTLVLHAKDDGIVPYELGLKLLDAARRSRSDAKNVEFVSFDGRHGYGHKHIHKAPNLPDIIKRFTLGETVTGNF